MSEDRGLGLSHEHQEKNKTIANGWTMESQDKVWRRAKPSPPTCKRIDTSHFREETLFVEKEFPRF
jgi:carbamate kinase